MYSRSSPPRIRSQPPWAVGEVEGDVCLVHVQHNRGFPYRGIRLSKLLCPSPRSMCRPQLLSLAYPQTAPAAASAGAQGAGSFWPPLSCISSADCVQFREPVSVHISGRVFGEGCLHDHVRLVRSAEDAFPFIWADGCSSAELVVQPHTVRPEIGRCLVRPRLTAQGPVNEESGAGETGPHPPPGKYR